MRRMIVLICISLSIVFVVAGSDFTSEGPMRARVIRIMNLPNTP